jgi:para-nitrobenzyl esterase
MLAAIFLLTALWASAAPIRIESGMLEGVPGRLPGVTVYRGVPYAAPPIGALRWMAPAPVAAWTGVRRADKFGPRCVQGTAGLAGNSEDCLYLNVWTKGAGKRPVMLWLHGGGFTGGAGSQALFDGEMLAAKGAVVVTINYRLGVFGFFAAKELTGNFGLLDSIEALQWVRKNIAALGGDPENVTVFGESAGATMAGCLTASPLAKGLFRRAIAESGNFTRDLMRLERAQSAGAQLLEKTGATSVEELRMKTASEIMESGRGTGPIVDGIVLTRQPVEIYEQGKANAVDLLLGSNSDEGASSLQRTGAELFTNQAKRRFGADAERYLALYPAGSDADANKSQAASFRDEVGYQARAWARLGRGKTYVYYFTHEPPYSPVQPWRGAFHTAEIPYVFHNFEPGRRWVDEDEFLAQQMSDYWYRFAATGDPNGGGLPRWPEFHDGVIVLGEPTEPAPDKARVEFWDSQRKKP